jgi:hypothetical protein
MKLHPVGTQPDSLHERLDSFREKMDSAREQMEEAVSRLTKSTAKVAKTFRTDFSGEPLPGLVAIVRKKDVDAHQGPDELRDKVRFDRVPKESMFRRSIHIFEGILSSALKRDSDRFRGGKRPSGFYQKGVGSIFFLEHDLNSAHAWVPDHVNAGTQNSDSSRHSVAGLMFLLSQTVAEYGSSLGKAEGEHIVINAKLKSRRDWDDAPSRLVLKVKKETVQEYHREKMDFAEFNKKVEWTKL